MTANEHGLIRPHSTLVNAVAALGESQRSAVADGVRLVRRVNVQRLVNHLTGVYARAG